jgi:hypothetical protein
MKKMLVLVVSVITFIAANAAEWGYAPQEKSVAVNFKNKADHYNFMAFGTPFPIPAQNLYRTANGSPMPKEWYTTRASKMGKVNLDSWTALLNAFPAEYRQQLLADNNLNANTLIDNEIALKIFNGPSVVYTAMPQGVQIVFDAFDTETNSVKAIKPRSAHQLTDGPEGGFSLQVTSFEDLFVKSAYCSNNRNSVDANMNIRKKMVATLPSDNNSGDYDAKAQGAQGPQGPKGDKGDKGEKGDPGSSLSNLDALAIYQAGLDKGAALSKNNCCGTTPATPGITPAPVLPPPVFPAASYANYGYVNTAPAILPAAQFNPYRPQAISDGIVGSLNAIGRTIVGVFGNQGQSCGGNNYVFTTQKQPVFPQQQQPVFQTQPQTSTCPNGQQPVWYTYPSGATQLLCPGSGGVTNPGLGTVTAGNTIDPGTVSNQGGGFGGVNDPGGSQQTPPIIPNPGGANNPAGFTAVGVNANNLMNNQVQGLNANGSFNVNYNSSNLQN